MTIKEQEQPNEWDTWMKWEEIAEKAKQNALYTYLSRQQTMDGLVSSCSKLDITGFPWEKLDMAAQTPLGKIGVVIACTFANSGFI